MPLERLKEALSESTKQRLRRIKRPAWFIRRRSIGPLSDNWGFDRGKPIDRYYIEHFLALHSPDIRGRVLEIRDSGYTIKFGTRVEERAVLDVDAANPSATIISDLANAQNMDSNQFDSFILTQTLQYIFDARAAVRNAHRILKPGGSLLVTVPAISRIYKEEVDLWRFTHESCRRIFSEFFEQTQLTVTCYGNALTASAFLQGVAAEELSRTQLETHDARFPTIVTVRAIK